MYVVAPTAHCAVVVMCGVCTLHHCALMSCSDAWHIASLRYGLHSGFSAVCVLPFLMSLIISILHPLRC